MDYLSQILYLPTTHIAFSQTPTQHQMGQFLGAGWPNWLVMSHLTKGSEIGIATHLINEIE